MSDLYDAATLADLEAAIGRWLATFADATPTVRAVERVEGDERRWFVRLAGDDKDVTTVWITLGQRTLRYETYVMPAPEENAGELYEHLLRRNERLIGAHFSIGTEDAVFLPRRAAPARRDCRRAGPGDRNALRHGRTGLRRPPADRFRQQISNQLSARRFPLAASDDAQGRCPGRRQSGMSGSLRRPGQPPGYVCSMAAGTFDLVIVGGGNMGAALAGGLLAGGIVAPGRLAVAETLAERRGQLAELLAGVHIAATIPPGSAAVLAVKPPDVPDAAQAAVANGARRLLSIAAGVTTREIEGAAATVTPEPVAVIRAMPNTPALVGQGTSAITGKVGGGRGRPRLGRGARRWVGLVVRVSEPELDAVTGLSGSGPAYVFLVAEALIDAAVEVGLSPELATALTTQLLVGSAALLAERGDPAALRVMVTSPGGTTAAGLDVLDDRAVRQAFRDAVAAATRRSRELSAER